MGPCRYTFRKTAATRRYHQSFWTGAFSVFTPVRANAAHSGGLILPSACNFSLMRSIRRTGGTSYAVVIGNTRRVRASLIEVVFEGLRALTEGIVISRVAAFSGRCERVHGDVFRVPRTSASPSFARNRDACKSARQRPKRGGASRGCRAPLRIESLPERCE